MRTCSIHGKTVSVFPADQSESPAIYLNTVSDEGRQVYEAAQAAGAPDEYVSDLRARPCRSLGE